MEVVRLSTGYLQSHGSGSPRLDAELLAATALGLRRLDLYLQFDRPLEEAQLGAIRALVRRRGEGEPVAYLTGEREFHGRAFIVTADVLIPRPETETLVEVTLARARSISADGAGLLIADVATGSGCIAVTLAAELPGARVVATDISAAALSVAGRNATRLGVVERVELRQGSWAEPLAGDSFDIVVANPPYVRTGEIATLARDVRDHEPAGALDGGDDGLDAYRALLPALPPVLGDGGWVAVEIDIHAAASVAELGLASLGRVSSSEHADLTGRPRVVSFDTAARPVRSGDVA
jgi:release factor glutamine methyltransferase